MEVDFLDGTHFSIAVYWQCIGARRTQKAKSSLTFMAPRQIP